MRDREPYDVTVWKMIAPWDLGGFQRGSTVGVEVSTTNPKKVRLTGGGPANFSAPIGTTRTVFGAPSTIDGDRSNQERSGGAPFVASDVGASWQSVAAVLKSFAPIAPNGETLGSPETSDGRLFVLTVELHFPNLEPMTGRAVHLVPVELVPRLSIGLKLPCLVDPADPAQRFAVLWAQVRPSMT